MKKLCLAVIIPVLILTLTGCSAAESFSTIAHEYLVSALGFDQNGDEITAFFETVVINSEDASAEKKNELLSGSGYDIDTALRHAADKATETLELSHCAAVVISESVDKEKIKEIFEFLSKEKSITLSIILISTENAGELLSCETISSVAVGYDIMNMQQANTRISGINYKNRFFELEAARKKDIKTFTLPYFKVTIGEYFIDGMTVYKEDSAVMRLDNQESSVYAIATDSQGKGILNFSDRQINVESVKTDCVLKGDIAPKIVLEAEIKTESGKEAEYEIKESIKNLFSASQELEVDLFSIGNIIERKKNDFYLKIKKDYYGFYKTAELEVIVK